MLTGKLNLANAQIVVEDGMSEDFFEGSCNAFDIRLIDLGTTVSQCSMLMVLTEIQDQIKLHHIESATAIPRNKMSMNVSLG